MSDKSALTPHDWARVFAHAWLDKDFKTALETNPLEAINGHSALTDLHGKIVHIPARPVDMTDGQLEQVRDGSASLPMANMCGFESC